MARRVLLRLSEEKIVGATARMQTHTGEDCRCDACKSTQLSPSCSPGLLGPPLVPQLLPSYSTGLILLFRSSYPLIPPLLPSCSPGLLNSVVAEHSAVSFGSYPVSHGDGVLTILTLEAAGPDDGYIEAALASLLRGLPEGAVAEVSSLSSLAPAEEVPLA